MLRKELVLFLTVMISSCMFALDGVIIKASGLNDGLLISGLRALGASIFILALNGRLPKFRKSGLFVGSMLGVLVGTLAFPMAILEIPVGVALILFHGAIIWIVVFKAVLRRPISRLDIVTGVTIFAGLIILLYQPTELNIPGLAIGVLGGLAFAFYLFLGEEETERVPEDRFVLIDAFIFGQIGIAILVILVFGRGMEQTLDLTSSGQQIVLMDGVMYGLAYIILTKAIKPGFSHLVAAYIGGLEPFLGILFARFFLGEKIGFQLVWGFLIVAGAIVTRALILYHRERGLLRVT
ncbi:MAG TPA: hypothetical protein PKA63_14570 [Oligoflexia bacterium]|nr:hypothetical protein [Oligoflexia bacterium]HMP49890.1 hypothetical protein [Oligoflexia bacterium]